MKRSEKNFVLTCILGLQAAACGTGALAATDNTSFDKREGDWRNGAVVYQVIVDRFVPSANLIAKRALYPAPKVLRDYFKKLREA